MTWQKQLMCRQLTHIFYIYFVHSKAAKKRWNIEPITIIAVIFMFDLQCTFVLNVLNVIKRCVPNI